MGVFNRCNTVEFRRQGNIEGALMGGGSAMHQMRAQRRQDVHLFHRPTKRASFWPNIHPDCLGFDQMHPSWKAAVGTSEISVDVRFLPCASTTALRIPWGRAPIARLSPIGDIPQRVRTRDEAARFSSDSRSGELGSAVKVKKRLRRRNQQNTINPNQSRCQETELNKVIERLRPYANPPLDASEPLRLKADGLTENPGVMGAGICRHLRPPGRHMLLRRIHVPRPRRLQRGRIPGPAQRPANRPGSLPQPGIAG